MTKPAPVKYRVGVQFAQSNMNIAYFAAMPCCGWRGQPVRGSEQALSP